MDREVLHQCLALALEGKMSFPETVQRMAGTGVQRYDADLMRFDKTHYAANGASHVEPIPLDETPVIAEQFCPDGVKSALVAIQQGKILYPEFLRRIMAAGTVGYSVYLEGRRAIYFGRLGDFHVEHFPAKK